MAYTPELTIDIRGCLAAVRKGWLFIAAACMAAVGLSLFLAAEAAEDLYAARASVYSVADSGEKAVLASALLRQYAELASSAKVLARAAALTGDASVTPEGLARQVSVQTKKDSPIIGITVTCPSSEAAVTAANAVAAVYVAELAAATGSHGFRILDPAAESVQTRSGALHGLLLCTSSALAAGVVSAAILVFVFVCREALSGRRIHA